MNASLSPFFAARDQLLELAGQPAKQREMFTWPDVGDSFNWAHDVFDVIAAGNDTVALHISETDTAGHNVTDVKRTFEELRVRSDQVAQWMLAQGARKGDVAMLMLGNRLELWEIMLAALKIGVVMLPTSVVLGANELVDRVDRGRVC